MNSYINRHPVGSGDVMGLSVCLAIIIHAVGIFLISFADEDTEKPGQEAIEVILVQQKSEVAPEEADFLAQASSQGGGESDESERPATPFVAPNPEQSPEIVAAAAMPFEPLTVQQQQATELEVVDELDPVEKPQEETEESDEPPIAKTEPVIAQVTKTPDIAESKSENKPETKSEPTEKPEPEKQVEAKPPTPSAAELVSRSMEMASLSAEIDRRLEQKAKRPRRDFISASTREYKYAAYMEAWRAKVERIGNLNYPDEARRKKLSGLLRMTVALNGDGTINDIVIDKSSGHQVLDDAAIHIVRLSAPFAIFPENIAKDVDILHITRTWKFLNNQKFSGD